ncbi:DUF2062 domain-containing protein [Pseudoxanthobacter sp.]|uniref:DUF2062 domain-containing protein n=1 Tax=Pseudoxanthobacter sp. TaxID=1925742 RepID=UPI002FE33607
MLFRRRHPLTWQQRARVALWPARSWRRSFYYMAKRILRLRATPHAIAVGTAAGVFISCTPLLGLHILLASAITWALGGNVIAAVLATWFGNPITFPIIWASTWQLGRWILEYGFGRAPDLSGFHPADLAARLTTYSLRDVWPVIEPMLVGSLPIGLACAFTAYAATRFAVNVFRRRQEERLALKREAASAQVRAELRQEQKEAAAARAPDDHASGDHASGDAASVAHGSGRPAVAGGGEGRS